MLKRKMTQTLESWHNNQLFNRDTTHKALIIDGARQTGKTYLIRCFAQDRYHDVVEINFFEQSDAAALIEQCKSAQEIIAVLSLLVGHEIQPRNTLVFFDEIQEAPQLITHVKFLVEDGRFDLILSGSLLGVQIKHIASFPVGYAQIEHMYPLDFEEFCWSQGVTEDLLDVVREAYRNKTPLPDNLHDQFVRLYRLYQIVGGMPEVVQKYLDTKYDLGAVRALQESIVEQYRFDASKYSEERSLQIRSIFDALPAELAKENKRFQLKALKQKAVFDRYANDFAWLVGAGVAYKCNCVNEPVFPLQRTEDRRKFKLYSSDTGLLLAQYPVGVSLNLLEGSRSVNFGAIYENAVAQELACKNVPLRYYHNNRRGEVDFIVETDEGAVVPLEVKSGKDYKRHVALTNLLREESFDIQEALVLSEANISATQKGSKPIYYLPLYMTFCIANQVTKRSTDSHAHSLLSAVDGTPPSITRP